MPDRRRKPRLHVRVPGVKPGQKIGPLGPFRGRLGAHWWVAALVVGALVVAAGGWFFLRAARPPGREAGSVSRIAPGSALEVLPGIFVARLEDGRPVGVQERPGCPLRYTESRYVDCRGRSYLLDGEPETPGPPALPPVAVQVHRGDLYVAG